MHHITVSFAFALSFASIVGLTGAAAVGFVIALMGSWFRVWFSVTGAQGIATCGTLLVLAVLAAAVFSLSGLVAVAAVMLGALSGICAGPRVG